MIAAEVRFEVKDEEKNQLADTNAAKKAHPEGSGSTLILLI